jgi:hypothetical protein
MKAVFEVVGQLIAKRGTAPLSLVVSDMVANFEFVLGQFGEAATIEQFGFEAAPKRFVMGVG